MNENVKTVLKSVLNLAINSGSSHFFTNIAVATLPPGVGAVTKVLTIGAASLMGSMMGDKTFDYTMDMVKNVKDAVHIEISSKDFEEEEK